MSKRLSPAFIELTQDALLKAFWYKPSLRLFLQQHGITGGALAQWHADQSKRDFILWLWPRLVKDEKGQNAILSMARSLAEMAHFPDLERKEDTKIRIPEAKTAISRLREAVQVINETIRETKDAVRRRRAAQEEIAVRIAAQQSLEKLQNRITEITPELGTQPGGYAFERWFYDLAIYFELDSRPGYTADGRQIDGAITIEGTTFLLETKFTKEPVGSPEIDTFMAKIESKADNTMGLFVSISGFNDGAKQAASKQRTPMLLLDHSHIFNLILRGMRSKSSRSADTPIPKGLESILARCWLASTKQETEIWWQSWNRLQRKVPAHASQLNNIRAEECPFFSLPPAGRSRWQRELTAAEMKRCHWVKPTMVCQIKFAEWTQDDRLRQQS